MPRNTESTIPSIPNLSFNPGINPPNAAAVVEQQQQQTMEQNQMSEQNILHTVKMASDLAQSFVEASKQRQQRDAIAAFAATQPNQDLAKVLTAYPDTTANALINNVVYPRPIRPLQDQIYQSKAADGTTHNYRIDQFNNTTDLGEAGAKPANPMGGTKATVMMPDGKAHIILTHPDNSKTDLGIAGSPSINVPTAQQRNTGGSADAVLQMIPQMTDLINRADAKGLIGPGSGRLYTQFLAGKIGTTGDPDSDALLGQMKQMNSLINSATLKAHFGARGGQQMYDIFHQNFDTGYQSKAQMLGALKSIQGLMDIYSKEGGGQGVAAIPSLTPPSNNRPPLGSFYKG